MVGSLLDNGIVVSVDTATRGIFWGPSSTFAYTIIQGIFTVLAIKELVSVTRAAIRGSSECLSVNNSILMTMVDDWEDLSKVFRRLLWPRPLHPTAYKRAPLNRVGWKRFFVSGLIAFWLFSVDIALIVLSVPSYSPQDAEFMSRISWANKGDIPLLSKDNTLQGSFSKAIKLESLDNDVEFTRLPTVSLERTDFRDFGVPIPEFDGRLLVCNNTELWRIICRIHCKKRFYQYKLRMDVATDTSDSTFFVPTAHISVSGPKNMLSDYGAAIETQLALKISGMKISKGYFEINTTTQPGEYTMLKNGDRVLTHDAIATLFLHSIVISGEKWNTTYYERHAGKRHEEEGRYPRGVIAISQRPYLPLLGTLLFYVVVQLISVIQQRAWKVGVHTQDLVALLEHAGGDLQNNPANVVIPDRPLVASCRWDGHAWREHIGFVPADVIDDIREFVDGSGEGVQVWKDEGWIS